MSNIAFKATDKNMKCRNIQYKLNTEFKYDGEIQLCLSGYHLCKNLEDIDNYYKFSEDNRYFIIKYGNNTLTKDDKTVTDKIIFLEEIFIENKKDFSQKR